MRRRPIVLSDNDLSDNDLSDSELSGNDLSGNDLSDNDLSDSELSDDELSDNDFSDSELSEIDLSHMGAKLNDSESDRACHTSPTVKIDFGRGRKCGQGQRSPLKPHNP